MSLALEKNKTNKILLVFFLNCHRRSFKEPTESAPDIEKKHAQHTVGRVLFIFPTAVRVCIVLATGATAIEIFVFEMEVLPYQLTL